MSLVLPRTRVVAVLLAGRGAYRIAVYGGGLALLGRWGPAAFAAYAAAVGTTAWLTPLVSSGLEKAALNLVPLRGGGHLAGFFRTAAVGAFAICLAAGALAGLVDGAAPYAAAGVFAAGVGGVTVLVALYRLQGRPLADSLAFFALAAAYAVVVAAAFLGAKPRDVLLMQCAAVVLVTAVLVARLHPLSSAPSEPGLAESGLAESGLAESGLAESGLAESGLAESGRAQLGTASATPVVGAAAGRGGAVSRTAAVRAAMVLGIADVVALAGVSTLYAAFAAAGEATETSLFYVLLVVSAAFSTGWGYLLRLAQPNVAIRIEHSGEAAGWSWARRCLMWTLVLGVPLAAGVAVFGRSPGSAYAAVAVEIALYAANAMSALLLEASGARGRRWSASGAVVQLAAVAGVGWLLVPLAGATGGIAALIAGELARAALLLALTRRR